MRLRLLYCDWRLRMVRNVMTVNKPKQVKKAIIRRRLLAVVPWTANGPGWANAGLHTYFEDIYEDGTVKTSEEWVYEKDLAPAERAVFRIGLEVNAVLSRRFHEKEIA